MRLVLDTNIYVSAMLSRYGPPGRLVRGVEKIEHYTPITSEEQIEELTRVFGYDRLNKRIRAGQAAVFLEGLRLIADVVTNLPEVDISPDPDDNAIIATAIAGKADLIVSGDKRHMVSLGEAAGIPIITARQALIRLGEEERGNDDG